MALIYDGSYSKEHKMGECPAAGCTCQARQMDGKTGSLPSMEDQTFARHGCEAAKFTQVLWLALGETRCLLVFSFISARAIEAVRCGSLDGLGMALEVEGCKTSGRPTLLEAVDS